MTNVQPPSVAAQQPVTLGTPAGLPEWPVCGGPATIRVEVYRPADGRTHGRLAGTVQVCMGDLEYVRAAAIAAGLTPYVLAGGDEVLRCGDGADLTGEARSLTPPEPGAGPVARPVVLPQPAGRRTARAEVLRSLSRLCYGVGQEALPAPTLVRFLDEVDPVVLVRFDVIAEAEQWATQLGAARDAQITDTIAESGHQVRIYTAWTRWQGRPLVLSAVVPPDGCPVPAGPRPAPVDLSTGQARPAESLVEVSS
ncbi:hypothetical protein AB0M91_09200 [Micromonospora rifamycinica]|uniref:hypothetical protein n=1 Tax=Micromonospora rifamycinica TaxID=291594 RepID=UPI003434A96E